jgi:hypothetical protein
MFREGYFSEKLSNQQKFMRGREGYQKLINPLNELQNIWDQGYMIVTSAEIFTVHWFLVVYLILKELHI